MLLSGKYLFPAILLAFIACRPPVKNTEPALLSYFQTTPRADTLHFEIAEGGADAPVSGDTIPNKLFFTALSPAFLQEIDYLADSSQALVLGRQRFPLNDSTDACLVDIRQFWFQNQSLLVYNKRQQAFTGRITVAEWYGGDGGQVLTGSWMLDYDNDGSPELIRREIEHTMRPDGDDVLEDFHESALILTWKQGRFVEQPVSDTALVVKQFPIRSVW